MNRRNFLSVLGSAVVGVPLMTSQQSNSVAPTVELVRTDLDTLQQFYGSGYWPTSHYRFREWHSNMWLPSMIDGKVV